MEPTPTAPQLVIHGHFYQPPRENPWTEQVGRERSAAPAHDWNERIAAECYRPNAVARVVDDQGRIVALVDNYEHLSYNVGPTLLSWLEREQPETYRQMTEADQRGGGAIAQAYGHTILPLATEDDARRQVRWGLADFRHRFGREATGMWLPECGVNDMVLRVLVEEGVRFTVLAPGQAASLRPLGADDDGWAAAKDLDTSRPYTWRHPDGLTLAIVFYDGSLSHAVAFEMSSLNSQALVDRMLNADSGRNGLVTLATDGETFGHHHRYGERLLAYALEFEAPSRGMTHTNLNRAVETTSTTHEVRVHESAWSCAHGVGRWKEDCSCSTGGEVGWNQRWRAPLRQALEQLRSTIAEVWQRRAPEVLSDPALAIDEYVRVVIGAESREDFAGRFVRKGADVEAFTLLEAERHAMAMFTSCGWFFNDVAGLETVQVLRYAARAIDLLEELGEPSPVEALLGALAEARSNTPTEGSGADVWHRQVETARVGADRVAEHLALVDVLEKRVVEELGPYAVAVHDHARERRGSLVLASGVADLTHRRTGRRWWVPYAAIGLGGLEVSGALGEVTTSSGADDDHPVVPPSLLAVRQRFQQGAPVAALVRSLAAIGDREFDLGAALVDEAERLMAETAEDLADRYMDAYQRLYEAHRPVMEDLVRRGFQLPAVLRAPAELALARRFREAVLGVESSTDLSAYEDAVAVARQARAAGFEVDSPATTDFVGRLVDDAVGQALAHPTNETVALAARILSLRSDLNVPLDLGPAQEAVYRAIGTDTAADPSATQVLFPLAEALGLRTTPE